MSVLGRGSVFAVVAAAILGVGAVAVAQQPAAVIEARQAAMKSLGAEMKAIGDAAKAGSITKDDAVARSRKISDVANQMNSWFPAGSGQSSGVKTAALPAIWEKPGDYKGAIDQFAGAAKLVAAAETGNAQAIAAAQGDVGRTCGGCHRGFRQRDN